MPSFIRMDDPQYGAAVDRIERALTRIERAAQARAFEADALGRRHTALRARMAEAVAALDQVIAREEAQG